MFLKRVARAKIAHYAARAAAESTIDAQVSSDGAFAAWVAEQEDLTRASSSFSSSYSYSNPSTNESSSSSSYSSSSSSSRPCSSSSAAAAAAVAAAGDDFIVISDQEDSDDAGSDDDGWGDAGCEGSPVLFIAPLFLPHIAVDEPDYPDFNGSHGSPEHAAYNTARKEYNRKRTVRKAKAKYKDVSRARLAADAYGAMTWKPLPAQKSFCMIEIGLILPSRWRCEQMCRALAAFLGLQKGISIKKTNEKLIATCPLCLDTTEFNVQPSTGEWKCARVFFSPHRSTCCGCQTPAGGARSGDKAKHCKSAYTPHQVSRLIFTAAAGQPHITGREIGIIVASKNIYARIPRSSFYTCVRKRLMAEKAMQREVQMAALEGYAALLEKCGHQVRPAQVFYLSVFSSGVLFYSFMRWLVLPGNDLHADRSRNAGRARCSCEARLPSAQEGRGH